MALCFAGLYRLVPAHRPVALLQQEELAWIGCVNIAYLRVIIYAISSFRQ
jgi:hypothetical protein